MHSRSAVILIALLFPLIADPAITAGADERYRLSGPVVHDNLAIYFVHGASSSGQVPLPLDEALTKGSVRVYETGSVNELAIENRGDEEVFVQSGDIVKGGQQDRALTVSLLLPPHSGRIPIAAFCVERGRWSRRGDEDVRQFSTAAAAIPSHDAKLAMKAPAALADPSATVGSGPPIRATFNTGERQREVWASVARVIDHLSSSLAVSVASPLSQTSLELALEHAQELKNAQLAYLAAVQPEGERDADIIGYVFAVNGKLSSADIYASNGLFRKMWPKLSTASATEAIAERHGAGAAAPSIEAVAAFMVAAEAGQATQRNLTENAQLETRDSDQALYFETRWSDGRWAHRNYLAK